MKLSANVTLPMMEVSSSSLDFSTVLCGQCKIITVRLYNTRQVKLVKLSNDWKGFVINVHVHVGVTGMQLQKNLQRRLVQ